MIQKRQTHLVKSGSRYFQKDVRGNCKSINSKFSGTFIYVESQVLRPANAGLSRAIAWLDSMTKANARSPDLGRELTQVLIMTLLIGSMSQPLLDWKSLD